MPIEILLFDCSRGESLFMLICYVSYCVALCFNTALEAWVQTLPYIPCKTVVEQEQLVTYKTMDSQIPKSPTGEQPQAEVSGQVTHAPGMAPRPDFYKAKEFDPNEVNIVT